MRNLFIPLSLAIMVAAPAAATSPKPPSMTCSFVTECIDGECADSGYSATVQLHAARQVDSTRTILSAAYQDDAETLDMQGMIVNGNRRLFNMDSEAGARLLTIGADGTARYTTHITEPAMAMTYLGQCEGDR